MQVQKQIKRKWWSWTTRDKKRKFAFSFSFSLSILNSSGCIYSVKYHSPINNCFYSFFLSQVSRLKFKFSFKIKNSLEITIDFRVWKNEPKLNHLNYRHILNSEYKLIIILHTKKTQENIFKYKEKIIKKIALNFLWFFLANSEQKMMKKDKKRNK